MCTYTERRIERVLHLYIKETFNFNSTISHTYRPTAGREGVQAVLHVRPPLVLQPYLFKTVKMKRA